MSEKTIAEKLEEIADGVSALYSKGHADGFEGGARKFKACVSHGLYFDFRNYEGESFEIESDLARTYTTEYDYGGSTNTRGLCSQNKNIKECKVIFPNATIARNSFYDCHNLEKVTVDMTKIVDDTQGYSGFNSTFRYCYALKRIEGKISLLNCDPENTFDRCDSLEYIAFVPLSINKSLSLTSCSNLSDEGRETLINGLADVSSGTAQTLSLHPTAKSKLTITDIARITEKGWTLA